MKTLTLALLLAVPLHAQTIEWSWNISAIPTIGDPSKVTMEIWVNEGDWQPLAYTCGPVIPDVTVPLDCSADGAKYLVGPGPFQILLRATREALVGFPFAVIAPLRVTGLVVPGSAPCAYQGTQKAYGSVLSERIPVAQSAARLALVRGDGWWVYPSTASATSILVRLVCLR